MTHNSTIRKGKFLALILVIVTVFTITAIPSEAASVDIPAYSTANHTVYFGPSSSNYAVVGSISSGERVYVLDKEKNTSWYHILYFIDGTNSMQRRTGYVPTSALESIGGTVPTRTYTGGGQRRATSSQTVWSTDDSHRVQVGSIDANEGVTLLYQSGSYAFIEYSTPSGTKRGYLQNPGLANDFYYGTGLARVKYNASLYYGNNTSIYDIAGSVGNNEYVTVLGRNDDWVYVEYNTTAGRKRGFFSQGNLDYHNNPSPLADLYMASYTPGPTSSAVAESVRSGPSTTYPVIGSLYVNDDIKIYYNSYTNGWVFVTYELSNGKRKGGWIYDG